MRSFIISNATVVTPSEVLQNTSVLVEHGIITHIAPEIDEQIAVFSIDADGAILMPGIIDIHTDAMDAEIVPRSGADIPINVAFRELERKMSGCGFTTVYHSMHLGYDMAELHSRSKYTRDEVFETVHRASKGSTLLNNKIHLRFELSGVKAYESCFELMDKGYVQLLSVMDHTPGQGQISKEYFIAFAMKMGKSAEEAEQAFIEKLAMPVIAGKELEAMIKHAQQLHIPVASHDDDSVEKVDYMRGLGIDICEFPITMETAKHAAQLGMHVVGGASNILRGGSLSGNLNMKDAVLQGAVDSLCSDYYPPAIIHAIFKLYNEEGMPLPEAVKMATLNPAKAVGINNHTGSIETGKDADLVIVKLLDGIPMVTHTIVRGHIVAQASNKINYNKDYQPDNNLSLTNEL
ncbi:alpha-D-ribose 1-methylphosphonate 5-triphosphate diphosphatase [Mucilaginibacter rubeus]|uniref:Alpha-D-ribose 1-methylphosphonate 5-triphosphate diphosphatase n=1 Tax=Mucilaginibacter rubeus TaxID=2027860 RepID=A0A5C1HW20_9SPHI|nr:alpha-D-ribose 1-methylphosphonate 5-triphosphate diphosphatase [Mucilaginibacter rubeus]QEM08978.1 alpha-D-ribose 1-methylphosphonate 5-triphosphate diphosphatase [Mucilaginibacter rubeus]